MDLAASRHYVGTRMQFLLLLSALLSAVTGAFVGPRTAHAQPNQVEAQQQAVVAAPARAQIAAVARERARPIRDGLSQPLPPIISAPAPAAPLTSVRWLE